MMKMTHYIAGVGGTALPGLTNLTTHNAQDGLQWLVIAVLVGLVIAVIYGDIKIGESTS